MNKYISKILISFGTLIVFLSLVNPIQAATLEDCMNATWTTPVGCDKILDSYYTGYYKSNYNNPYYYNNQYSYSNSQYAYNQPTTPIVNNYYQAIPVNTSKKVVSTSTTTKSTSNSNTSVKSDNTSSTNTDKESSSVNNNQGFNSNGLPALSFAGSGGFLPSSFWQWIIVIFLILIIIILARLIGKSSHKDNHAISAH